MINIISATIEIAVIKEALEQFNYQFRLNYRCRHIIVGAALRIYCSPTTAISHHTKQHNYRVRAILSAMVYYMFTVFSVSSDPYTKLIR